MKNFLIVESLLLLVMFVTSYFLGLLVLKKGVKVNYTRKGAVFLWIFAVAGLEVFFPKQIPSYTLAILVRGFFFCLWIWGMSAWFRDRFRFSEVCFASIDRPEDRPFTLWWLTSQNLTTYAVILLLVKLLSFVEAQALISISLLASGIGDSLAEPVGTRFGKHKYSTKGFFCDRTYSRSLEGSACVLLTTVVGVWLCRGIFTPTQLIVAYAILPLLLTIAEAKSPHTWDNPFIMLSGGLATYGIVAWV